MAARRLGRVKRKIEVKEIVMQHIVSLSGGTASAVAADRVLTRYGHDATTLWFADTSWEDADLYRFLIDLESYWGKEIVRYKDGRNPLEVAEQASIIPSSKIAPCSLKLKVEPFRKYLKKMEKPVTVHLGLDWTEQHRAVRPKATYEAMGGVSVDLPLMWEPIAKPPHRIITERWGIKTPRLYDLGFPHNNCGGRCVRQGIGEWVRLKATFPERFAEVKEWEILQRAKGGGRAKFSITKHRVAGEVKSLPLAQLEAQYAGGQQLMLGGAPSQEDLFSCFCSY
jgi:hypothetical protein